MRPDEVARIRRDAHEGIYRCSLCGRASEFPDTLTLWHAGVPFFGACASCIERVEVRVCARSDRLRVTVGPSEPEHAAIVSPSTTAHR